MRSRHSLLAAGLMLFAMGLSGWACPVPKATVEPTTVCAGDQSTAMAGYDEGACPPVGSPWISAMSLDITGLTPPAGGVIDLPSAAITWTTAGYARLVVESSIKYQCAGGPIQTVTRTTNFLFTVCKVEFKKDDVVVCWSDDGTYDAKGNLMDDSFNKDRLKWMIKKIEGVAALVDNDGKITFGSGGGKYTVTATSEDNVLCSDSFTLNVVELITIEGSYADFVGEEKSGVKIYAAAENFFGSVIYKAEIFPKISADKLPYGCIRWEGYNILYDQLTAYRHKRSEDVKGTIVSATCGDITKSARQHVFRTCKQPLKVVVQATVKQDDSIVTAGYFGETDRSDARLSTDNKIWVYYVDSQGWYYDLRSRKYILRWGKSSRQRVNATLEIVAQSPFPLGYQMTEKCYPTDKSRLLVAWLDFLTGGMLWPDGRTIRRHYWSSALTERHELFHCSDWQPYYRAELLKVDSLIDTITHRISLSCLSYDAALDAKRKLIEVNIQQVFDPAAKAYKEGPRNKGHEVRAYADGKALYDVLSEACKQAAGN